MIPEEQGKFTDKYNRLVIEEKARTNVQAGIWGGVFVMFMIGAFEVGNGLYILMRRWDVPSIAHLGFLVGCFGLIYLGVCWWIYKYLSKVSSLLLWVRPLRPLQPPDPVSNPR